MRTGWLQFLLQGPDVKSIVYRVTTCREKLEKSVNVRELRKSWEIVREGNIS